MAELGVPERGSFGVELFLRCLEYAYRVAERPALRVSSWKRTVSQQADLLEQSRGVVNSLHLQGLAMDLVGDIDALNRMRAAWRSLELDAVIGGGDQLVDGEIILPNGARVPNLVRTRYYLHIELDGPGLARRGLVFKTPA